MAKTVKITGTFEITDSAGTTECKQILSDSLSVTSVTTLNPHSIAAAQSNSQLAFGGVATAKRIFIKTDQEVTLKVNSTGVAGFNFGPGEGVLMNSSGITALYVTTGANATEVVAIIAGV